MLRCLLVLLLVPLTSFAGDPNGVLRFDKGYRYSQAGWIVVHIEGDPYPRGVQHGRLLAPEIAAHLRCFAATLSPKSPADSWKLVRLLTNAVFLRGYDKEYLEEMKGIADGASAAGARFDGRRLDVVDIAALNLWPEIETLDSALLATPTGLESLLAQKELPMPAPTPKPARCSAFAATGPATKDGKIVFGHITMFRLYPSNFYNVWLDVQPSKGHRVVMQSFPGGIHSGMDYYINSAGILINETTIAQTKFDGKGAPLASRIRKAIQYADSIDGAVEILKKDNNGLYTNEWLLGDINTNEIAMFELGTNKTKLWRSSKDEWFGGTKGFYWGCNNTKDLEVRLETIPGLTAKPGSTLFVPSVRDKKWLELFDRHNGKIDESWGKLASTTPPLCAFSSVDAKFTTADMAKRLETHAIFGPPLGRVWHPTPEERSKFPEIRPLVPNSWTVLTAKAPGAGKETVKAVDIFDPSAEQLPKAEDEDKELHTVKAWRGTFTAKNDGDLWLTAAFPAYERIVAMERAKAKSERLAVALHEFRAEYELACRAAKEVSLSEVKHSFRDAHWHGVARGKGVLFLHALRQKMGLEAFTKSMDDFGIANAGKEVTTAMFREHLGKDHAKLFDSWLTETGLPEKSSAGPFAVTTFYPEIEQTRIVYGTKDDAAANLEAAKALQQSLRRRGMNVTVEISKDTEIDEETLKNHHLLLVGRPSANTIAQRFAESLPATFGSASFRLSGQLYANPDTAVLLATENPLNRRYSVVVIAGLGAEATVAAVEIFARRDFNGGETVLLERNKRPRAMVRK